MRFCPQCGAPLLAGAKFCVECGRALDVAAPGAGETGSVGAVRRGSTAITTAFVSVFTTLAAVCLAVAALINLKIWPFNGVTAPAAPPVSIAQSVAPPSNPASAAPP